MDRVSRRELFFSVAGACYTGFPRIKLSIGRPVNALQTAEIASDDDEQPVPGDDVGGPEERRR